MYRIEGMDNNEFFIEKAFEAARIPKSKLIDQVEQLRREVLELRAENLRLKHRAEHLQVPERDWAAAE